MQKVGAKKRTMTIINTIVVLLMVAMLPVGQAYSACLFCKGGALSIDKPLDKGGALSIDKPLDKGGTLSIDKPLDKGGALSIDKPLDKGGALSIDKPLDKGGALSIDKPLDKGGALSIDKPLDKGGALSIDKPFDTPFAKAVGKAATDVWDAVRRPFVETAKFLKDPLAGLKQMANDLGDRAKRAGDDLGNTVVKWLIIGFSALIGSVVIVATMLAALIIRRTRTNLPSAPEKQKT